jgi:hypothetical protein
MLAKVRKTTGCRGLKLFSSRQANNAFGIAFLLDEHWLFMGSSLCHSLVRQYYSQLFSYNLFKPQRHSASELHEESMLWLLNRRYPFDMTNTYADEWDTAARYANFQAHINMKGTLCKQAEFCCTRTRVRRNERRIEVYCRYQNKNILRVKL